MKSKINFLISNNFTNDNRTRRQAKALVEAGHDVTIYCTKIAAKLPDEEYVDGIRVKRVLEDWLPTLPKNKEHWRECKKYLEAVLSDKAEVYICKDLDTLFYGWRAKKKYSSKLVYNADEYWQDLTLGGLGPKTKIYYKVVFYFLERYLAKKADLVTTVNDALAEKIRKVLRLKSKPLVIMNAPELEKIESNNKLIKDSGFDEVLIYVGIFSEGRGLESLIEATDKIDEKIGVVLLGYGNLQPSLEKMIKEKGLEKRIKILSPVAPEKLLSYISSAKIGIIPVLPISTSYRLCLPNKFFEYVLAGVPICSTDLPVISELINQYQIGAVYEPGNSEDLAKAVNEMIYNKSKYDSCKNNLKKAASELHWGIEKQKFLKAIKELQS